MNPNKQLATYFFGICMDLEKFSLKHLFLELNVSKVVEISKLKRSMENQLLDSFEKY